MANKPSLPDSVAEKLTSLQSGAQKWHELSDAERAVVARKCRVQFQTFDLDWVADNMRCIGLEPSKYDKNNTASFDPFLFIATVASRLDKIAENLEGKLKVGEHPDIAFDRQLPEEGPSIYKMGAVGQSAPGVNLELWAESKGESKEPTSADKPGVGVVLGAGNQNFITAVDVIELAFVQKKCVLLKHHPLRHFMANPIAHILKPLADAGAYAQCLDSDLNNAHSALVTHPIVMHVHMTGSGATHDRVWAGIVEAKRDSDILFTSELGCVTPWIVCPGKANNGEWSQTDIENHATMLSAAFKSSCSMNCLSPKVLVLPSESLWPQRSAFLKALREKLATMAQPPPYYPGAHKRFVGFEEKYPDAEHIEAPPAQEARDALTTAVYPQLGQDLSPLSSLLVDVGTIGDKDCRTYALQTEAFSPVLAIATVACEKAEDFPMAAAKAVNEHVFGTLSCNVIYPDERDEDLDKMLQTLNYGCVAVNHWAALLFSNALGVWGGAPGSYEPSNPQSGLGFVGNAACIPGASKSVGISPFEPNKRVIMEQAMPYLMADAFTIFVSGKKFAGMRALGLVLRRGFGLFKPLPGAKCA